MAYNATLEYSFNFHFILYQYLGRISVEIVAGTARTIAHYVRLVKEAKGFPTPRTEVWAEAAPSTRNRTASAPCNRWDWIVRC
jgi:hypothetical protein